MERVKNSWHPQQATITLRGPGLFETRMLTRGPPGEGVGGVSADSGES